MKVLATISPGAHRRWRWPFRSRGSRHEPAVAQITSGWAYERQRHGGL
jgi:hypothetical protein